MKHTLLTSTHVSPNNDYRDSLHNFCTSAAKTLGVDVDDEVQMYNKSLRSEHPINEFRSSEFLRTAAHPDVFMFGTSYGEKGGTLTAKRVIHLLGQFTNAAACNRNFIFSQLDMMQRHQQTREMKAKVNRDPAAFLAMAEKFLSAEFKTMLKKAVANPVSKDAQKVMAEVGPVLKSSQKKTVYGVMEKYSASGEILAMGRRYGAASNFTSFTFNDTQHPNSVRLTFRSPDNDTFPAVAEDAFLGALEEGSRFLGSGEVDCSWANLAARVTENPVAAVTAYKRVVIDVLTILLGIAPANTNGDEVRSLKTVVLDSKKVGVINGTPVALLAVNEANNRGVLHMHFINWGGIPPKVLSVAANIPRLCQEVSETLNCFYRSSLPRDLHVRYLVNKELLQYPVAPNKGRPARRRRVARSLVMPPDPQEQDVFDRHSCVSSSRCCLHEHCFRCHKGNGGKLGCGMAMPRGLKESTGPVELVDDTPEGAPADRVQYRVLDNIRPVNDPTVVRRPNDDLYPLGVPDRRILCWETKREKIEGLPILEEREDGDDGQEAPGNSALRNQILHELKRAMSLDLRPLAEYRFKTTVSADKLPRSISSLQDDSLSLYIPPRDGNGLFRSVAMGLYILGMQLISTKLLRENLMDELISCADEVALNGITWREAVQKECGCVLEEHAAKMRDDTPYRCKRGGKLELMLCNKKFGINLAVYHHISDIDEEENSPELTLDNTVGDGSTGGSFSDKTVCLVSSHGLHYKLICPLQYHPDRFLMAMDQEEVNATMADLGTLKTEEIKELYEKVSKDLPGRNGWVAEFNPFLLAVMGCNTNSILLGCEEQSKSAAFYIGKKYFCANCSCKTAAALDSPIFFRCAFRPLYEEEPGRSL